MEEMYIGDIPHPHCGGLEGFVGRKGKNLKERIREKFKDKVDAEWNIDIEVGKNKPKNYFVLYLIYSGRQNTYEMDFSFEKETPKSRRLIIHRFPGIRIRKTKESQKAYPNELRLAADISDDMDAFLIENFGESVAYRGDGCPVYRTHLPEEYAPNPSS